MIKPRPLDVTNDDILQLNADVASVDTAVPDAVDKANATPDAVDKRAADSAPSVDNAVPVPRVRLISKPKMTIARRRI